MTTEREPGSEEPLEAVPVEPAITVGDAVAALSPAHLAAYVRHRLWRRHARRLPNDIPGLGTRRR